jgi:hypothetical protein
MSFIGKSESKSRWNTIVVVEIAAITGFIAFIAWSPGCNSSQSSSGAAADLFQRKRAAMQTAQESPAPAPAETSSASGVLPWVVRDSQYSATETGRTAAASAAAAAAAAAAARAPSAAGAATPPTNPDAADEAALKAATGGWTPDKAREIGSTRGLLFKLGASLLSHPKVVRLILNNDYVVDGFMSQDRVRANCNDASTLSGYLGNSGDSTGIAMGLASIRSSLDTPGSAEAIFGSKLVSTVLSRCGSIQAVSSDPSTVKMIAGTNQQMAAMLQDGRLISAVMSNSSTAAVLNNVRSSLAAPAPQSP